MHDSSFITAESAPDEEERLEETVKEAQEELVRELDQLDAVKTPLLCKWGFHSYIGIDPSDEEHAELCTLLGRSRANMTLADVKDLLDRVCSRCGYIDPGLQRFIVALRKLRAVGKRR